jgi:hypothetical protein
MSQARLIPAGVGGSALARPTKASTRALPRHAFPYDPASLNSPAWIYTFLAIEMGLQLLIITPWGDQARVLVRTGGFAASFSLLFLMRRSGLAHPAGKVAIASLVVVTASIFHPDTNGVLAGCAQAFLYLAVLGPIFWVPRIRIDLDTVRRVFVVLWIFNTASAVLGALQVYFPGRFQPAISSAMSDDYLSALSFELPDGTRVLRPMGLTNGPGGAAIGAMYSIVLGVALLLNRPRAWVRFGLVLAMGIAFFTICLAQVRALMVMTTVSLLSLGIPFVAQRRGQRSLSFALPISIIAIVGVLVAAVVGGDVVTSRLSSLIADDPATVYADNRGIFLKHTFLTLLPEYPVGAGLGRWGVMSAYFGNRLSSAPALWAEIQWTGWLYDGGIPLVILSACGMLIALRVSLRIATTGTTAAELELQKWATVVFGFSVGALALTFSAVPFQATMGIEFWLLSAMIFAASCQLSAPSPVLP